MPEQEAGGPTIEVVEGRFYVNGAEVSEQEAREAGWSPDPDPAAGPGSVQEGTNGAEPTQDTGEPILDRLRAAYAAGGEDRSTVLDIAPGRYDGLAARYEPIDWDLRRKLLRRNERMGAHGPEANANFQATLGADACQAIMMRPEPGSDYVELHTLVGSMKDGGPIRYDKRLAAVLGIQLHGAETEADIMRLVFGGEAAFEVHFGLLTQWSAQSIDFDEDEDEGDGEARPT